MDANELADAICDYTRRGFETEDMAQKRRMALHKEVAAELRRLKALEKDAMRYRWLRAPENANQDEWNLFGPYSTPSEIDAAIDAAMEAK